MKPPTRPSFGQVGKRFVESLKQPVNPGGGPLRKPLGKLRSEAIRMLRKAGMKGPLSEAALNRVVQGMAKANTKYTSERAGYGRMGGRYRLINTTRKK